MKIVHITESFIEGWGYQENLLPLYQKRAGHDVVVISDNNHLNIIKNQPSLYEEIIARGNEYIFDGIKTYKIKTRFNKASTSFYCSGLYEILKKENPEVIFHHNVGMSTLSVAARYKRKHPKTKLYVDNHADWINVSKNLLWRKLYYGIIAPLHVYLLGESVNYYIGVSPLRCQFLNKVFKIPNCKIRFLPIGCDTNQADIIDRTKEEIRGDYGLTLSDFVVVSGGKIDRSKGTLELIAACDDLITKGMKIRLVLFGKIDREVQSEAEQHAWIKTLGWCDRVTTISLLKMADVACWPWLHTTLIEDSIASGTPLVVKLSDNVTHFANEKAGVFLTSGDRKELSKALLEIMGEENKYRDNVKRARNKYSYHSLVQLLQSEKFCEL